MLLRSTFLIAHCMLFAADASAQQMDVQRLPAEQLRLFKEVMPKDFAQIPRVGTSQRLGIEEDIPKHTEPETKIILDAFNALPEAERSKLPRSNNGEFEHIDPGEAGKLEEIPGISKESIESIQNSTSITNCREFFEQKNYRQRRDDFLNALIRTNSTIETARLKMNSDMLSEFADLTEEFDIKCQDKFPSLRQKFPEIAIRYAQIFAKNQPICGSFNIVDNIYITAAHCFFEKGSGFPKYSLRKLRVEHPYSLIQARRSLRVGIHRVVPIDGILDSEIKGGRLRLENWLTADFVLFVSSESGRKMKFGRLGAANENARLIVPGFFDLFRVRDVFEGRARRKIGVEWRKGLRWTSSDNCRSVAVSDSCIAHLCQTQARFSGGPTVEIDATGGITLVGIHVMSSIPNQQVTESCSIPTVLRYTNLAIIPDWKRVFEVIMEIKNSGQNTGGS